MRKNDFLKENSIKRIKCHNCDYEWISKSKSKYLTCPMCYYKVNVVKATIDKMEI